MALSGESCGHVERNRDWLLASMHPYFFVAMNDEPAALATLARELGSLKQNRRLILADREKSTILARINQPGSLYETLRTIQEQEISYAMIAHSEAPVPGMEQELEIQRFEFDRKSNRQINDAGTVSIPAGIRSRIVAALKESYPGFELRELDRLLRIIWLNNENYVRISPPRRVAQLLWLYHQGNANGGLYLDVEELDSEAGQGESRVLFAVANPPQQDFLLQVMEVFNRLDLGVRRAYCLTVSNGVHPYFLGTFYVKRRDQAALLKGSELFCRLQQELYNTQVLSTWSTTYREFVTTRVMSGEDASLINAMMAFCHTNLAHNHPDRFSREEVVNAFYLHPEIALELVRLFRVRFQPGPEEREALYGDVLATTTRAVEEYNTGHRYLDEIRRSIYRCALLFIRHTLKTNFFVPAKQALAFRLDPAYLTELGTEFTADLPPALPFRVTFFFGRFGCGYHVGFSDIARGGWRTIIARSRDDYTTSANTLFREVYVLANTQHLKNKDIYEGGSKMVVVLDASDLKERERDLETWRLYKLQYGFANAFLDLFVTSDGVASDPNVVDYYREDEPIEIGPDENMHDSMVETIARLSVKRGYLLGIGIISSKRVGINHKEYGVTSAGVTAFAEITMQAQGIDIRRDPFSVKFTGGPNGDVAGNGMRLLLERCPQVRFSLIVDGTAALVDPTGADHDELRRIVLKNDLDAFDPKRLNPGGFMLLRSGRRMEGLRELYRRVERTADGLKEEWISLDEFSRQYGELVFTVPADLFIPAGGRPETIDRDNWQQFFLPDGRPSSAVIVEGANSFITPEARCELQRRGVVIMRDASANKCGVISSSYEIIANLLLTEREFLDHKERYVADVLEILAKRAEDEARLILRRRREPDCTLLYTEISDAISQEINALYARLFKFFQGHPELCLQPLFRQAILNHLPRLLRETPAYRQRIKRLPAKYLFAILAAEIASSMVYQGNREDDFADLIKGHLRRNLA
ncbi:NAD-glutamate dehydrogenase domain-containing protein [Geobacter sp. SVR]|uniref:NAD-glutamate dehydrogenase domain-containing protein n=1 Tax=Geobacter sp. SVR TaxID=2495594 RepID=UPI001EF36827|nr:NAD-glutamate dehydrogenase domain-containing protein [Geobacter sp. SVR]